MKFFETLHDIFLQSVRKWKQCFRVEVFYSTVWAVAHKTLGFYQITIQNSYVNGYQLLAIESIKVMIGKDEIWVKRLTIICRSIYIHSNPKYII